jgi:hypothetical protein
MHPLQGCLRRHQTSTQEVEHVSPEKRISDIPGIASRTGSSQIDIENNAMGCENKELASN